MSDEKKEIKLGAALVPVFFLIVALFVTIKIFGLLPHIPLISAAAVAAAVAIYFKRPWKEIHEGMVHGINLAMGAIL
ncbi:MAG: Na+/H+ antiporter NhaC, partial [Candidatus Aminicenantes bacterium]